MGGVSNHPHRSAKFRALRQWWGARNSQPIRCYGVQVQYQDKAGEWRHLAHLSEIVETPQGEFAAHGMPLEPLDQR